KEIAKVNVPEVYPQVLALPITLRPLFPTFYKAVTITHPPVIKAIRELLAHGQPYIGAFLFKDSESDADVITSLDQVHPVGVFAQITSTFEPPEKPKAFGKDGKEEAPEPKALTVVLYPHRRIRIDELVTSTQSGESVPIAKVVEEVQRDQMDEGEVSSFERDIPSVDAVREELGTPPAEPVEEEDNTPKKPLSQIGFLHSLLPDVSLTNVSNFQVEPYKKDSQMIRALMAELISSFKDLAQLAPIFRDQIASFTMAHSTTNVFDDPERLADFAAAVSTGEASDLQNLLESTSIEDRLQKALTILKKELINAQLQQKISKDVESKIQKRQREYYLIEQLKGIKRELGMESDGKDKLVEKFKEKAEKLAMPEGTRKVFDEELSKLVGLEQVSSEFAVTRNYLDWLTAVPWGVHSPENFNIPHARQVLDDDHYGLKDVKDRILEFLAVGKLRGSVQGKIICLSGPPGVGKTSIGKSIARALGRQFYRFSVGGLNDVAEIKGHRRTYIGAMPGKAVQALKKVQVENPLILIDEIDKIGAGRMNGGDPQGAILEMLDPEQNGSFLDHYLDVPIDLSRVLFVCTANVLHTIPRPLLDRLEVIELSGYVAAEKKAIAERFLGPQAKEQSGLKDVDVDISPEAVDTIIRWYARESGVRNLKKLIEKVYRKAAFKIVPDTVHIRITPDNLRDYVGAPYFQTDRIWSSPPPPGVSHGLAASGEGQGTVLPIEVSSMPGKGNLQLTGKLGEVIRESAQLAVSWVKSNAFALGITKSDADTILTDRDIHLHMPEGAIGKDGPSAGTALVVALVSLLTKTKVDWDIALTGEISLLGQVLRVGGLKEKTLAAHRTGIKKLIVPLGCRAEIEENVPDSVKEGIEFVYVDSVRQVLHEVFKGEEIAER
ncbi:LONM protease, partial [Spelaeornis formosus]|nr:LONM protease [Elachura formosa]